jgi:hypothetical protein
MIYILEMAVLSNGNSEMFFLWSEILCRMFTVYV